MEMRLHRSHLSRGSKTVYGSDWNRYMAIRNPLREVLSQCLQLDVENAIDLGKHYLVLRLLKQETELSNARTGHPDYDAGLEQLYVDLNQVCSAIEDCEIDRETGCISLPGSELTVLGAVKYESVIRLLDALAAGDCSSTAILTWRMEDRNHTLRVRSKAALRAIEAQALWRLKQENSNSEPTTQNGGPDDGSRPASVNNGDEADRDNSKTQKTPISYVVKEILSDFVFVDINDEIIALKGLSIAGARVGDTILLHGCQMVPSDNYHAMTADSLEIHSQGDLGFG